MSYLQNKFFKLAAAIKPGNSKPSNDSQDQYYRQEQMMKLRIIKCNIRPVNFVNRNCRYNRQYNKRRRKHNATIFNEFDKGVKQQSYNKKHEVNCKNQGGHIDEIV